MGLAHESRDLYEAIKWSISVRGGQSAGQKLAHQRNQRYNSQPEADTTGRSTALPCGRMESVTIDRLAAWLTALGRTVEIRVRPYDRHAETGHFVR